jgi:hypothetical protein
MSGTAPDMRSFGSLHEASILTVLLLSKEIGRYLVAISPPSALVARPAEVNYRPASRPAGLSFSESVFVQRGDGFRDRRDAQRDVSVAGEFVPDVHQNVGGRIAGIGVEHEIELHSVLVANDRDIVALGAAHHGEPEHPVKVQCAVEISHSNPDVIDPLDCDALGHRDFHASGSVGPAARLKHRQAAHDDDQSHQDGGLTSYVKIPATNSSSQRTVLPIPPANHRRRWLGVVRNPRGLLADAIISEAIFVSALVR